MDLNRCGRCGHEVSSESRFCSQCGAPVSHRSELGERRTVSILFADLSGYTAMSEQLDPETVKTVVASALGRLADEVVRHGGHVDKFIGDNVMALFGAPTAHEDDPLRAVLTGLAMQDAMAEINADVGVSVGHELRLCVGVNTGEVLAGAMGQGYTVVGDAVNVAARLQSAADPGAVLVGPTTHAATSAQVEYENVGRVALKGKADDVPAWRARAARPATAVDERPAEHRMVGRDAELEHLESLFRHAVFDERAVVATVLGEPGVGKSRLARELGARVGDAQVLWGTSVPYGAGSAYFAVGEVLKSRFGIGEDDDAEAAGEALDGGVGDLLDDPDLRRRTVHALAPLVGATSDVSTSDDPDAVRSEVFSAVRLVLAQVAAKQPLVLVLEDLHWADSGVLDLVDYLGESLPAPVLVVCLARPELAGRAPDLVSGERREVVRLGPLSTAEVVELVDAVTGQGSAGLPTDAVVARCGGIPLFVEEMVRHLEEVGGEGAGGVPLTLQGLLVARLDLLEPEERRLLQRASVVGTSFTEEDLHDAASAGPPLDQDVVARLCDKGFLRRDPEGLHFHHVLMRDAAYSLLPKAERARWHMETAERWELRSGFEAADIALVAEHYLQAATLAEEGYLPDPDRERAREGALRHLLDAGDRAGNLSSDEAALAQYESAMALTSSADLLIDLSERIGDAAWRIGDTPRAIEAWLRAQSLLPETSAHRLAELDRRLGRAYLQVGERARAIERYQFGINRLLPSGADPGLMKLYEDAALLYADSGENMLAIYTGERALAVAEELQMVAAASRARGVFALVLGRLGNAEAARSTFDAALAAPGLDDGTRAGILRSYAHHLRLHEGDADAATERLDDALAFADALEDIPLQVEIAGELASIALDAGDWLRVEQLTVTCEKLRNESGHTGRRALPLRLRAWTAADQGDLVASRRLFRQAHENAVATGDADEAVAALRGSAVLELRDGPTSAAVGLLRDAQRLCDAGDMRSGYVDVVSLLVIALVRAGEPDAATLALEEARERAGGSSLPAGRAALLEAQGVLEADRALLEQASEQWDAIGHHVDASRSRGWFETIA